VNVARWRQVIAAAALGVATRVYCADNSIWIATGEATTEDYYFGLGVIIPLPGYMLGHGWVQRYWIDRYTYSYQSGVGQIDAGVWGAEGMLGYQASKSRLYGAAYIGLRYANTDLSPDDPGNEARGGQLRLRGQLEGTAEFSERWRGEGIAAYTFGLNGYWTRARLLRSLSESRFIGPELILQGDPTYNAQKIGIVYGGIKPFGNGISVNVHGGYRFQSGADAPYVGIELVGMF
jgi:hypothetical protein